MTSEADHRLPRTAVPRHYDLTLEPDLDAASFAGHVVIDLTLTQNLDTLVFNAAELEITSAELTDATSGRGIAGSVRLDEEREQATLTLDSTATPGEWSLALAFTGTLNDDLRGFYRSTYRIDGEAKVMATTQFEATEARRAFPCWDEPDLKATFDITLVVPSDLMAISNSPIVAEEDAGQGRRRVRFGTTMKMSTYLVAFIVGDLIATEPVDVDGVPLRIVTVPGKGHLTDFALDVGAFALRFYADYYAIPYPGDKVDMIAVPDFAWGAMENLGAITYRETALLVDPATATQAELARVADVIAHELAHMWFGDLVTMKWWNGIWLNEAFATFMELQCVDAYRPDWKRWLNFAADRNASMDIDALTSTRPIEIPVGSPEEANAMFDILTYSKGAAVLRMLEQYLGAETFRSGISRYLSEHAYANTETHDLWAALETESGEPVGEIMDSWIFQGGHPRIDVARIDVARIDVTDIDVTGTEPGVRLEQSHAQFGGGTERRWLVPARFRTDDDAGRVLVTAEPTSIAAGDGFFLNDGGQGYFRTRYQDDLMSVVTAGVADLVDHERYVVVADTWAGVLAGDVPAERYLDLVAGLGDETDPTVWGAILTGLDELHRVVTPTVRPALERFVSSLAGPAFARIGWQPGAGEDDLQRQLRGNLLVALGTLGADEVIRAEARSLFDRIESGKRDIDSEVANAAIRIVAAAGDGSVHDRLTAAFQAATSPQEEDRYLVAIAAVPDAAAAVETIDMVVDGRIRSQNAGATVARLVGHRTVGPAAWAEVTRRWDEVIDRLPKLTARTAISFIHLRSEPEVAGEIATWLAAHPLPGAETYTAQQLERLDVRIGLRNRAADLVVPGSDS